MNASGDAGEKRVAKNEGMNFVLLIITPRHCFKLIEHSLVRTIEIERETILSSSS